MANAVTKIETLTGTGYTLDFTSISGAYDDLMVIGSAKSDQTSNGSVAGNSFISALTAIVLLIMHTVTGVPPPQGATIICKLALAQSHFRAVQQAKAAT